MARCKIKLCGIRTLAAVRVAAEMQADYIGFILSPSSKRSVSLKLAQQLSHEAKIYGLKTIAVFYRQTPDEIAAILSQLNVDGIQLYDPFPAVDMFSEYLIFFAYPYDGVNSEKNIGSNQFILVESKRPGSGQNFQYLHFIPPLQPWFLAGGLNDKNVQQAITRFKPNGVDVASGIENDDGQVDEKMIVNFIQAVRAVEGNDATL